MDEKIYYPNLENCKTFKIDENKYNEMYEESISSPEKFWGRMGNRIDWINPFTKVKNTSFSYDNVSINWYEDGTLNISYNCIDRHLKDNKHKVAIIGSGVSGLAAAWHLRKQGYKVTVFEQDKEIGGKLVQVIPSERLDHVV